MKHGQKKKTLTINKQIPFGAICAKTKNSFTNKRVRIESKTISIALNTLFHIVLRQTITFKVVACLNLYSNNSLIFSGSTCTIMQPTHFIK